MTLWHPKRVFFGTLVKNSLFQLIIFRKFSSKVQLIHKYFNCNTESLLEKFYKPQIISSIILKIKAQFIFKILKFKIKLTYQKYQTVQQFNLSSLFFQSIKYFMKILIIR